MDHGPAVQYDEREELKDYKQKLGLKLFYVYALFYAVFVILNAVFPAMVENVVFLGLNLAIIYGISLIIVAILLGLVYNAFCTKKETEFESGKKTEGESK